MHTTPIEILHRNDLTLGGFAGLKEHRLVQDRKAWGFHKDPMAWDGIGNFVYLADAQFIPHGETGMHPHREIDVISIMVEGRISHRGSLGDGQIITAPQVQIQSAGGEGFEHNEVNPDETKNRMLQLWVLPDQQGMTAGYRVIDPDQGQITRIYGGIPNQQTSFPSTTLIEVAMLTDSQQIDVDNPFIAYLSKGRGVANGMEVTDGDLMRGESLRFQAAEDVQLTIIRGAGY